MSKFDEKYAEQQRKWRITRNEAIERVRDKIEEKIAENIKKANTLLNKNIDLWYEHDTVGYKITEKEETIGKGKNKKTVLVRRKNWIEDFVDEDSGEVVSIERSYIIAVNGQKTDRFGKPLQYHELCN